MFEDRTDIRYFLSRLAREVRDGRVEVHAWCVLTTHFHLLVRSPQGQLSEALRRIQSAYSRSFNRRHRRDGTLIRGRFLSKPVTTYEYWQMLVRYIDANPVRAGLCTRAWHYPWCSASQYVQRSGPRWLARACVEREVVEAVGRSDFDPSDYRRVFGMSAAQGAARLVEERIHCPAGPDFLGDLIGVAPAAVLAWMRRKAKLADGMPIGLPVLDATSVRSAVETAEAAHGSWGVRPHGRPTNAWRLVEVGLLRSFAGLTWKRIATEMGWSSTTGQQRFATHRALLETDEMYGERFSAVLANGIATCHGGVPSRSRNTVYTRPAS